MGGGKLCKGVLKFIKGPKIKLKGSEIIYGSIRYNEQFSKYPFKENYPTVTCLCNLPSLESCLDSSLPPEISNNSYWERVGDTR